MTDAPSPPVLLELFQIVQGRILDAQGTLAAGNFEALIEDLRALVEDIEILREAVFDLLEARDDPDDDEEKGS